MILFKDRNVPFDRPNNKINNDNPRTKMTRLPVQKPERTRQKSNGDLHAGSQGEPVSIFRILAFPIKPEDRFRPRSV